jgi:DNA-binding MarR family transcriptional regulator
LLYCREDHDGIRPVPEHPIRLDLDDYLPYLVNRVGSIMALRFGEDVLAQFGLSIAMWRVLAALSSNGAQRHTDLAGLTSIEVSTLSRIVTRLVRMGLVVRAPSKTSGREIAVALSDRGRRLVDRLIPLGRRYEEIASAGLSKQENVVLRRALRHMYRNLINAEPMAVKDRPAGSDAAIRPTSRPETPTI